MVNATGINAIGWTELLDGNLIQAPFTMYNIAWGGWFIALLYFVVQLMLYLKTRSVLPGFIIGAFFASIYAGSQIYVTGDMTFINNQSMQAIAMSLLLQFAGVLYTLIWK